MSGSLESRVERRFMEIEDRLRGYGNGIPHQGKFVPIKIDYIE